MFSSGSYHGLSYVAEDTFGVTPVSPTYKALRHTSSSIALSKDSFQSNELRSDRQIADFRHGAIRIGGDIGIELSYAEFDALLEAALFDEWSSNELRAGVLPKSFTMRRRFHDINVDGVFTGCMVNTLSLSIPANAMVTGSFGVIGKEGSYIATPYVATIEVTNECTVDGNVTVTIDGTPYAVAVTTTENTPALVAAEIASILDAVSGITATLSTATVTVTKSSVDGDAVTLSIAYASTGVTATVVGPNPSPVTASETNPPYDSFSGTIEEGGSTIATVTSIDLSLANGLEPAFVVGANTTPQITPGRSNLTGTVSAYFEDLALLTKFIAETETSIELTLGSTSKTLTFLLPRVKYSGGDNPVSGEGPIMINMPFQALYDTVEGSNIVITRTP